MPFLPSPISCALRSSSESVGLERGQVAHRGLVALRHFAGFEHDAVHGKHLLHVGRRELAAVGDDLDHASCAAAPS